MGNSFHDGPELKFERFLDVRRRSAPPAPSGEFAGWYTARNQSAIMSQVGTTGKLSGEQLYHAFSPLASLPES